MGLLAEPRICMRLGKRGSFISFVTVIRTG